MTIKQLIRKLNLLRAEFYLTAARDTEKALEVQKEIDAIENMLITGEGVQV